MQIFQNSEEILTLISQMQTLTSRNQKALVESTSDYHRSESKEKARKLKVILMQIYQKSKAILTLISQMQTLRSRNQKALVESTSDYHRLELKEKYRKLKVILMQTYRKSKAILMPT